VRHGKWKTPSVGSREKLKPYSTPLLVIRMSAALPTNVNDRDDAAQLDSDHPRRYQHRKEIQARSFSGSNKMPNPLGERSNSLQPAIPPSKPERNLKHLPQATHLLATCLLQPSAKDAKYPAKPCEPYPVREILSEETRIPSYQTRQREEAAEASLLAAEYYSPAASSSTPSPSSSPAPARPSPSSSSLHSTSAAAASARLCTSAKPDTWAT